MDLHNLIEGHKRFKKIEFTKYKDDFETLVKHGQKPSVLFIGCSDSRVVPDLIVDANPGDMFLLRNIANFVPPYKDDQDFHGSTAVIEYAVSILCVKDIIVCGHSHCGGCAALYDELDEKTLPHVKKWLELGQNAKNYAIKHTKVDAPFEEILRRTEKASVVSQLENLLSYPEIEKKIKNNELNIHGWYYHIEDGSIEVYDPQKKEYTML
jgi:carbonic anhydrase